jgi:hypothetical protein
VVLMLEMMLEDVKHIPKIYVFYYIDRIIELCYHSLHMQLSKKQFRNNAVNKNKEKHI